MDFVLPFSSEKLVRVRYIVPKQSTAHISVTAESVVDSAEQFEFGPIRSSKFQINQPVAFKIQIVQLILMY